MSVYGIRVGKMYVGVGTEHGQVPVLTTVSKQMLVFPEHEAAQRLCDSLRYHPHILAEEWAERRVVQGWYVISKFGQFLTGRTDEVGWSDWKSARLFESFQEVASFVAARREISEALSLEFDGAEIRLAFNN